jgi:hypothetical protein
MPSATIYLPYIFDLSANAVVFGEAVTGISADYYLQEDVAETVLSAADLRAALLYKDDEADPNVYDLGLTELPAPVSTATIESSINKLCNDSTVGKLKHWSGSTEYANSSTNFSSAYLPEHYIQYIASLLFGHPQAQAPIKNDEEMEADLSNDNIGAQFCGAQGLNALDVRKFLLEQLINADKSRFNTDHTGSTIEMPFAQGDEIIFRVRMQGGLSADGATSFTSNGVASAAINLSSVFGTITDSNNPSNVLLQSGVTVNPRVWAIKLVLKA